MNIKKKFAILLLAQCLFSQIFAASGSGLVVIIDQKSMSAHPTVIKNALNLHDRSFLLEQNLLAEVLDLAPKKVGTTSDLPELASIWDKARLAWIEQKANGKYSKIYSLLGESARNPEIFKRLLKDALTNHLVVDLFILAHSNEGYPIPEKKELTTLPGKFRIFGAESGNFGNIDYFKILEPVAMFMQSSSLQRVPVSTPYILEFLNQWLNGQNFHMAIKIAKQAGDEFLQNRTSFMFARLFDSYKDHNEALEASRILDRGREGCDLNKITLKSSPQQCQEGKGQTSAKPDETDQKTTKPVTKPKAKIPWVCSICTLENNFDATICAVCENPCVQSEEKI